MKKTIFFCFFLIIFSCLNIFGQTTSKDIAYIYYENILSKSVNEKASQKGIRDRKSYGNFFLFNRNEKEETINDEEKESVKTLGTKHIFAISAVYLNKKLHIGEDDFSYAMEPNTLSPTFQVGMTFTNAYNNGIGLQVGALLERTSDSYIIHSERYYEVGLFDTYENCKINQYSLYLPIRLQYRFNFNDYIISYIHIGLGLDIGLRANLKYHSEIYLQDETKIVDYSQNLYGNYWNNCNLLFELGLGIDIKKFQIGISQAYGMTNVMKGKGRIQEPFAVNIGFLF